MGYRVSPLPKNPSRWRVLHRRAELDPKTGKWKDRHRHVKISEYAQLGIRKEMSRAEAEAVLKRLNINAERARLEDRRNKIAERLSEESAIECAHLPPVFVEKYETDHLPTKYLGRDERLNKILKLWRAAQRLIRRVPKPMEQWHRYPAHFYSYIEKQAMSPGYAKNIMAEVNAWMLFLGYEQGKHYLPVPPPDHVWASRIVDAFEGAEKSRASAPITPEELERVQKSDKLPEGQYRWLYATVWAGLRPNEASALLNKKRTRVKYIEGTPVLEVYQSKLKNVPKSEDRWKYIPLFLPEQRRILDFIEEGLIEEPLAKTVSARFGEGHTLYAGRKGFHDLMVTRYGQPELEVIRWLGHRSLDMAMKHYAKKDAVRWLPVKPKGAA